MEENAIGKHLIKRQKTFPWLKTFLDKLRKKFPDCSEDLMQYLLENLNNEVKTVTANLNRKRMKILFETLQDLFLHFWWRMRWENEKMWKKYWKKGCTGNCNNDLRTKYVVKLLYFVIYIGIKLSKGAIGSPWIKRILQAVNVLPDCDNIICSSLLLVENLKKKYRSSYYEILKNVLISKTTKCISEPLVYMKIMVLFRRLKENLKHTVEKREFLSTISKFQAPYNLIPWMTSFDLDVSQLKKENISQLLFKSSFNDLFKKLQPIVAENEFLPSREESKGSKNSAANLKSSFDLDSTFNFFHSSGDLEVEEKGSIRTPAKKNKKKSEKKSEERKSKPEKQESRVTVSLDATNSMPFDNGEDDDETSNLGVTPSSPTTINKISLDKTHLDDVNSGNKSVSLPQLCAGDHQMPASAITDETNTKSNKVEVKMKKRKSLSKKDKISKTEMGIPTTKIKKKSKNKKEKRKSEKEESRVAVSFDETHSVAFNSGNDDEEITNLGVSLSYPATVNENAINLNDINSYNKSVGLSLQLSSPKQDALLCNPASQLSGGGHQMPASPITDETNIKSYKVKDKMEKSKSKCKKEKTSKTDMTIPTTKIKAKSEKESKKRKRKSKKEESRIAVSLDETHSVAFDNGKDDEEITNLGVSLSSPATVNENAINLSDMNSYNKSVSLNLQLSSPKRDGLLCNPASQLSGGGHQMPASSIMVEANIKSNKDKMKKRKSKCKKDKTSKTDTRISTTKNKKKSKKESKKRKRKSEKEESRIAVSLDETHSVAFDNGEDDDETVNLDVTPSSPSIINKNAINLHDINSCSKSVNFSLQLSSPKQDTLLFNPAIQTNAGDHHTPSSPKMNEINAKDNEIVDKMKTKELSEKDETSKTDKKVSAKKTERKYERKREKSMSEKGEWGLAKNLDEAHSVVLNNREDDDDETADLGFTPSSLVTINNAAVNLDGISSSNKSVDLSLQLSSPKRDILLSNSVQQLNAGDHRVPSSPTDNENNTKIIEIVEKVKKRKILNLSKTKTGRKKMKLLNCDAFESATNPIEVHSNKEVLCSASESPLNFSANENTAQNGDYRIPSSPQTNETNTKSNKLGKKIKVKKSLNLSKKETGRKKIKLFNPNTFESTTNPIELHSNKEVLCNASGSPVNFSANENTAQNVNILHNSPKGKVLSSDKNVLDKLSRVCEKSCLKVVEDMVSKEKVYSHIEDDVTYNTQSAPLFDSMPDLSTEDNVIYNTQSAPLYDSMPDLSTDQYNSFETEKDNSTLHRNSNHSFSGNPILYKESSISKDTCGGNRNEVNTVYDETTDPILNFVGNQTPLHLQHVNVINPESQTPNDANNLDCDSARLENFNFENNSEILEQLCSSFNSLTNVDSNSNSDSFVHNAVRVNESRNSVNEDVEFSGSRNLNQTGNGTVGVSANGFVIPSNRVLSSNTDPDGNTSLVIDCSFVNNTTNHQQSECRLNSDISSIKLVINLNKKHGDNMQLQQPNKCCAGNFKLNAMPLCGNTASNTNTDSINLSQRTAFPITSSSPVIPPQCSVSSCSRCDINNRPQKTSMQPQLEVRVPQNLTSSTPYQRHEKTSAQKTSNNPCNMANYFASPLQCVPSTSQRRMSTDDSEFYSPHTSDCESNGPAVDVRVRSSATPSSLQKRLIETNVESASNPMQMNITPAISRLKRDHILHSSRNSSRQLQPFHNLSKESSLSNKSYRNSSNDIYSDVSCDDISVSSMGIISDEETDHSFLKGLSGRSSSESPLKKKNCGSNNNFRARTINNSSIECHSTPGSNCHRSKKVSFSNLNCGSTKRSEKTSNSTKTTRTYTKRHKKNPIKSRYQLRNRRKICKPATLDDYLVKL